MAIPSPERTRIHLKPRSRNSEHYREVTTERWERDLQYLGNGRVAGSASQHVQLYLLVEQMC